MRIGLQMRGSLVIDRAHGGLRLQVKGIVAREADLDEALATLHGIEAVRTKSPSKRIFPEVVKRLTLVSAGWRTCAPPLMDLKSNLPAHCVQTREPSVVRTMI